MRNFRNRLIVSCQDYVDSMIPAAIDGGAGGIRVNGVYGVVEVYKYNNSVPIIACQKRIIEGFDTYITPEFNDAKVLIEAGADYVAFDAREHGGSVQIRRCVPVKAMVDFIHGAGALAVADVEGDQDGLAAWKCGADIIATTFAVKLSLGVCYSLSRVGVKVMAEGGIRTPEQAVEHIRAGADLICVGSAITRPHDITKWFVQALEGA